jgi:uncharacterized membrane protein
MPYKLIKSTNNNITFCSNKLIIILIIILFFLFIVNICYNNYEYFDILKNKTNKNAVCSKNCCSTQWTTNIDVTEKSNITVDEVNNNYNKTNLTCNNGITNTGCVCISKEAEDLKIEPSKNNINAFKLIDDKNNVSLMQSDELTHSSDSNEISGFNLDKFNHYGNI